MQTISFIPSPDLQHLPFHFVVSDCPPTDKMKDYATTFMKYHVTHVIRVCEASAYDKNALEAMARQEDQPSFQVHDEIKFEDGSIPDPNTIAIYFNLLQSDRLTSAVSDANLKQKEPPAIAIHCVSGLGRAPVLVVLALLVYCDHLEVLDAVEYIRRFRRGALNRVQLKWLEEVFDQTLRKKWVKELKKRRGPSSSPKRARLPAEKVSVDSAQIEAEPKRSKSWLKRWFS